MKSDDVKRIVTVSIDKLPKGEDAVNKIKELMKEYSKEVDFDIEFPDTIKN
jgi:hypothetical protein